MIKKYVASKSALLGIMALLLWLFTPETANAQTCQINFNPKVSCKGSNPVSFSASNVTGGTISSYKWYYGDGGTGTSSSSSHVYNTAGTFTPRLVVYFSNGDSCVALNGSVVVHDQPVVDFQLKSVDQQCFMGNQFCFNDTSRSATPGVPIRKRTILWGDGARDTALGKSICHSYMSDPAGGVFTVTVEIEDSNGCFSRFEYKNLITVFPSLGVKFSTSFVVGCMQTPVTFKNLTSLPQAQVSRFIWDFGDGNFDSTQWDNFIHVYRQNGDFDAKLTVWNLAGCKEEFFLPKAGSNVFFKFDVIKDKDSSCFKDNAFIFTQTPVANYNGQKPRFMWNFGDPDAQQLNFDTVNWTAPHSYTSCEPKPPGPNGGKNPDAWFAANGMNNITPTKFYVSLWVKIGPCDTVWYRDSVEVLGPQATIETIGTTPKNRYQCNTDSPVYFTNLSKYCTAKDVIRMWDFGDSDCPQCTTDTKNGINVGVNCNFSRDSLPIHKYTTPRCYVARLMLWDPVLGCGDTAQAILALQPPDARKMEIQVDPNGGPLGCFGPEPYGVTFRLSKVEPTCTKRWVEINFDSCAVSTSPTDNGKGIVGQSGPNGKWTAQTGFVPLSLRNMPWMVALLDPNMPMPSQVRKNYTSTACNDGWVTVGLTVHQYLIQGTDTIQRCVDTAWYHKAMLFLPGNASGTATANGASYACRPSTVKITLNDTLQDSIKSVTWDLGAYFDPLTNDYYPEGKIVDSIYRNPRYIGSPDSMIIRYYYKGFDLVDTDTFSTKKISPPYPYRSEDHIPTVYHTYERPGIYFINVTLINTADCESKVRQGPSPFINGWQYSWEADDTILCVGQEVNFTSNIRYWNADFDPTFIDPVAYWEDPANYKERLQWDFGDGSPNVVVAHPTHVYTAPGQYTVKLIMKDSVMPVPCVDSLVRVKHITVVDPRAYIKHFENPVVCGAPVQFFDSSMVKDVLGINNYDSILPSNLYGYYWEFGDGKTPSTLKDPFHDYTSNDTFYVKLKVTTYNGCVDSTVKMIWFMGPRPKFNIVNDTVGCVPFTVLFDNESIEAKPGNNTTTWQWDFGEGDPNRFLSTHSDSSVAHTYTLPGEYEIYLYQLDTFINPYTGLKTTCSALFPDTTVPGAKRIKVKVLPTPPAKTIASKYTVCLNEVVTFTDQSDTIYKDYRWDFGDGSRDSTLSPNKEVKHAYTSTGQKMVIYTPTYIPAPGEVRCLDKDTIIIDVIDIEANFEIADSSLMPLFKFRNTSVGGVRYWWNYDTDRNNADFNQDDNMETQHDYKNDTGTFRVCLIAQNSEGCLDTVCKDVRNHFSTDLKVYNVFTPGNSDGKNDKFDIVIDGELVYNLVIYNRWGQKVFESTDKNIDWDGTKFNKGDPCPAGAYYFVLDYQLRAQEQKQLNGSITLIRQ